jgi:lysophospholipase L1-like esterase
MRYKIIFATLLASMANFVFMHSGRSSAGAPVSVQCGSFTTARLPESTPQTDPEAVERFQIINREAKAGSHTILFLGDSLIQKWDRSLWARNFAPLDALNAGVNGDRTEHLLWRIEHGNIDRQRAEIAVLLIGTNDIGRNRPARNIAEGVRQILFALRSRLPKTRVLLLGVLPRSESPASERRRQVSEVNRLIRTCADGEQVIYADVGDALLDRGGRLTREVSPDGVHLSEHGYRLLSDRLQLEFGRLPPMK